MSGQSRFVDQQHKHVIVMNNTLVISVLDIYSSITLANDTMTVSEKSRPSIYYSLLSH